MISCQTAQSLVSLRIDGELPSERSWELDGHLESCAACRAVAGRDTAVAARLRRGLATEPSLVAELQRSVESRLALDNDGSRAGPAPPSAAWSRRRAARFPRLASGFGAAAAGLLFALTLWYGTDLVRDAENPLAPSDPGVGGARTVLREQSQRLDRRPVDGDPDLWLKELRLRVMTSEPPLQGGGDDRWVGPEMSLELERTDRRLVRPAGNPWH